MSHKESFGGNSLTNLQALHITFMHPSSFPALIYWGEVTSQVVFGGSVDDAV